MNIFAVSSRPTRCARFLDDKRLVKMCVETAQILSAYGYGPYRLTHKNHPATVWSKRWIEWTVALVVELCNEYTFRFNRVHATQTALESNKKFCLVKARLPKQGYTIPTDWPTCFNERFSDFQTHKAYRATLVAKWRKDKVAPRWTKRKPPRIALQRFSLEVNCVRSKRTKLLVNKYVIRKSKNERNTKSLLRANRSTCLVFC